MANSTARTYQWWPAYRKNQVEYAGRHLFLGTVVAELLFAAVFLLPGVAEATGITPGRLLVVVVAHLTCVGLNTFFLTPLVEKHVWAFHAQVASALAYNLGLTLAVVVLTGDPKSLWWMAVVLYAAVIGSAQEMEASFGLLLVFMLAPLVTTPLFLAQEIDASRAWGGPLLTGAICALTYDLLARTSAGWRRQRALLQGRIADLERQQLARELHDSMGSTLTLFARSGDLIERHSGDPVRLGQLAHALREGARTGLGELRAIIDGLSPHGADLDALRRGLLRLGERATELGGVRVSVAVEGAPDAELDGRVRLATIRVFQEALTNALRHGRAASFTATLRADGGHLEGDFHDDGVGFIPTQSPTGNGLAGMKTRAEELGGALEISSSRGAGTRVRLRLPLETRVRFASRN